jgi:hypothetical protein
MAHQVHDCATTHVMTIRIGRAGLKRLIPAGRDSLLSALAGLSGGANRGRDPYQEPKHPRRHTLALTTEPLMDEKPRTLNSKRSEGNFPDGSLFVGGMAIIATTFAQ